MGGEVSPNRLEKRIYSSKQLLLGYCNEFLVAVAAIKQPSLTYKKTIFQKAGIGDSAKQYEFELGWMFVHELHRRKRYSTLLTDEATRVLGNSSSYATTRTTNNRMHQTLTRFGFTRAGATWRSSRGNYDLSLFVR
jgi:GNAT superfamily N-acetyltransferase